MPAIARLGDTCSHGGNITTASTNALCNNRGIARTGDTLLCAQHGPQVLTGTAKNKANGRSIVTVGVVAPCGAVITTGSPNTNTI